MSVLLRAVMAHHLAPSSPCVPSDVLLRVRLRRAGLAGGTIRHTLPAPATDVMRSQALRPQGLPGATIEGR